MEGNREYQKVIDYLCDEIREGRIRQGDRLPTERVISEQLQISRNSTREALRSMDYMGIIESVQGSGNYYTGNVSRRLSEMLRIFLRIKLVSQEEICDFRRMMEKAICAAVIENPEMNLQEMECLLEQGDTGEQEDAAEHDRKFHYLLAEASGNHLWMELMDAVSDVYREWIDEILSRSDEQTRQELHWAHREIFRALKEKDRKACEAAIDAHYDLVAIAQNT